MAFSLILARRWGAAAVLASLVVLGPGRAAADDSAEPGGSGRTAVPRPAEPLPEAREGGTLVSLRISGSALKPREDDVSYGVNANGSCTYVTAGDASTVWNHKLTSLPNGAVVDTLRMYYYDTSGSNTTAWFTIYDLYGSIVNEWAVSSSTSTGNSFSDSPQINHTIDYSVYSYVLNWRPVVTGSTIQLCGFRIFYQP